MKVAVGSVPLGVRDELASMQNLLPSELRPAIEKLATAFADRNCAGYALLKRAKLTEQQQADFLFFAVSAAVPRAVYRRVSISSKKAAKLATKVSKKAEELAALLDQLVELGRFEPEALSVRALLEAALARHAAAVPDGERLFLLWPNDIQDSPPSVAACLRTLALATEGRVAWDVAPNMLAGSTANFHAWQYLRNLWSLLDDYWDGEVVGSRALASAMALAAKALTGQTPPAPHNIYRHILSKRRTPTV